MLFNVILLLVVASSVVEAGPIPIPNPTLRWLYENPFFPPSIAKLMSRSHPRQVQSSQSQSSTPGASSVSLSGSLPSSSSTAGGFVGIVPAIPNNPTNTAPLTTPLTLPGLPSASTTGGTSPSSITGALNSVGASAIPSSSSNGTDANASNSAPTGKMIGIVVAVPNDPVNSPPLTSVPPVPAPVLSAASAQLVSSGATNEAPTSTAIASASQIASQAAPIISSASAAPLTISISFQTTSQGILSSQLGSTGPLAAGAVSAASSAPLAVKPSSQSAALAVSSSVLASTSPLISTTSFQGVHSTTFPLIGDSPPAASPALSTSSSIPTPTGVAPAQTYSFVVSGSAVSSTVTPVSESISYVTVIQTRTETILAAATTTTAFNSGDNGNSTPQEGPRSKHHTRQQSRYSHSLSPSMASAPAPNSPSKPSALPALLTIPSILPGTPVTTMTIAAPSPSGGLLIVPINPNAINAVNAANGVTVTVTTTVGLVTETYVLLSTTTVSP